MKRYNNLYSRLFSFENLLVAANQAQKGKRFNPAVLQFNARLEKELLYLSKTLQDHSYQPGGYTPFWVFDKGKKRYISRAPYRDRVVHHALINIIKPVFDPTLITDCYANRKGKGTHRCVDHAQAFCAKNRYVLQCDISKYFPSIDHQILKQIVRRKISDSEILWLVDTIIDASNEQEEPYCWYFPGDDLITPLVRRRGIPIGNLTSQFFANLYMSGLDHFVKEKLHCRFYLRYVDDFLCFDNEKGRLHEYKKKISIYLEGLRLVLHPKKSLVFPTRIGIPFLGYKIFPHYSRLSKQNSMGFRKRLQHYCQEYSTGKKDLHDFTPSIQAWIAHAEHANTFQLRKALFNEAVFTRKNS